jgi:hypothetical protein
LTFSINVTVDGCVDHQEGIAGDETHAFFTRLPRALTQSSPAWPDDGVERVAVLDFPLESLDDAASRAAVLQALLP